MVAHPGNVLCRQLTLQDSPHGGITHFRGVDLCTVFILPMNPTEFQVPWFLPPWWPDLYSISLPHCHYVWNSVDIDRIVLKGLFPLSSTSKSREFFCAPWIVACEFIFSIAGGTVSRAPGGFAIIPYLTILVTYFSLSGSFWKMGSSGCVNLRPNRYVCLLHLRCRGGYGFWQELHYSRGLLFSCSVARVCFHVICCRWHAALPNSNSNFCRFFRDACRRCSSYSPDPLCIFPLRFPFKADVCTAIVVQQPLLII